ncbi:hypothetical protein RFI_29562 [Reticulomyxa filosa]|uniref:Uncharacterized protein n=1 Tax=Reticulomyxa filosa TaxID=46433 RepID=X6M2L6_RETFI|nr:hypothetical protein RFI_29562 [Reticulomyxa filosa]|eukprot:ETO07826.1 hypothetical protein RFI_29562 [Reticulomyxa filosa]
MCSFLVQSIYLNALYVNTIFIFFKKTLNENLLDFFKQQIKIKHMFQSNQISLMSSYFSFNQTKTLSSADPDNIIFNNSFIHILHIMFFENIDIPYSNEQNKSYILLSFLLLLCNCEISTHQTIRLCPLKICNDFDYLFFFHSKIQPLPIFYFCIIKVFPLLQIKNAISFVLVFKKFQNRLKKNLKIQIIKTLLSISKNE